MTRHTTVLALVAVFVAMASASDSSAKTAWAAKVVGTNVLSYVAGRDFVVAMVSSTDPTADPPVVQAFNRTTGAVLWFHPTIQDHGYHGDAHADDTFSALSLSPDENYIAYTRCSPRHNRSSVWLLFTVGGTCAKAGTTFAQWSTATRCKDATPPVFHQDAMLLCLGQRVVAFLTQYVGAPLRDAMLGSPDDFCGTHITAGTNATSGRAYIGAYGESHPKLFAIGFNNMTWWNAWGGISSFAFDDAAKFGSPRASAASGIVATWVEGGERFHALDANTGKPLWRTSGDACGVNSKQLISAIVGDNGVYLSSYVAVDAGGKGKVNCVAKVSRRDASRVLWTWVGIASNGTDANVMRPPILTAGSTSGHRDGLIIGTVGCRYLRDPSSPSVFAVDAKTGSQVWGPIALNDGYTELLSPIAYRNETVYAALTAFSRMPSITALTLPQSPHTGL